MRVTVFGAAGGIGRLVVQQLLDQGHYVTALTRSPDKLNLTRPHLDLITGRLSDRTAVQQAVAGTDAVISALGPSLKRSTAGTQLADGTRTIVEVMAEAKVSRFSGLATPSLADPRDNPHWKHKVLPVMAKPAPRQSPDAECPVPRARLPGQAGLMFSACGPFWPCVTSNVTAWPSWSSRKPEELIAE